MMNYVAALLGIALLGSITTAAVYRGDSLSWQNKYLTLQTSYQTAADKARADAQAQEAKDTAALKLQSSQALQQAQTQASNAQLQLRAYQAKLKADAGMKDLGHVCSGVEIPKDLIP